MVKRKSKSEVMKKRSKKKEKSIIASLFKWFFILFIFLSLLGCAGLAGLFFYISQDLPKINTLKDYRPATVTSVFSDDGRKIGEFYEERRIVIPLSTMPDNLLKAFVAAEIQGSGNTRELILFP
jgi:penicillin-binding protein 1A